MKPSEIARKDILMELEELKAKKEIAVQTLKDINKLEVHLNNLLSVL